VEVIVRLVVQRDSPLECYLLTGCAQCCEYFEKRMSLLSDECAAENQPFSSLSLRHGRSSLRSKNPNIFAAGLSGSQGANCDNPPPLDPVLRWRSVGAAGPTLPWY
jgi:hypothetical protein